MCIFHRHPEHARYAPLDEQRQETRWAMGSGSWDEKVTRRMFEWATPGEVKKKKRVSSTSPPHGGPVVVKDITAPSPFPVR